MEMLMLRLQNRTSQNSQKSFGSYIHLQDLKAAQSLSKAQ